ncbi:MULTISPECIES: hypothetical protein [unclassified Sulfurospirillum]|uniref:hypothetical protein n=1 Tax=unclassified Sulfurospirillum TaxID=2618290 RepID=UPI0025CC8C5E|nr:MULTISPECIES: hypothetical protein [unclassified Sulfurospirillum]
MHSSPSHIDLNPKLSHIGQGTNCTAQPTVDNVLSHEREKAKRRNDRPIETMEL